MSSINAIAALLLASTWAIPAAQAAPSRLPLRITMQQAKIDAQTRMLRHNWASAHPGQARDATMPDIVSVTVQTPMLSVQTAPSAPAVTVKYTTGSAGLQYLYVFMTSPNGQQFITLNYFEPNGLGPKSGSVTLQEPTGFAGGGGALPPYAEPGTWSVSQVEISDQAGNFATADASVLTGATFTVSNSNTPDVTPPKVTKGKIMTKSVSASAAVPYFIASIGGSDDVSGISDADLELTTPVGDEIETYFAESNLPAPLGSGSVVTYADLSGAPAGTYTIAEYAVCDVAGNCTFSQSATDVKALFGKTTFQVTN